MRQNTGPRETAEKHVRDIRRKHSAEDKIRIVLSGLRGEYSIAELCRREGIAQSLYYSWSKEFLEAGKKRLGLPRLELCLVSVEVRPPITRLAAQRWFSRQIGQSAEEIAMQNANQALNRLRP